MAGVGQGDQQAPGADPDAVDEHRVVDLPGDGHARLERPAPGRFVAEGTAGSAVDFSLAGFPGQPGQEASQLVTAGQVGPFADA